MACRASHRLACLQGRCGAPPVRVGNVYKAKSTGPRGWRAGTRYWLVMCVSPTTVHMLGLDQGGRIVSTTSYGVHVLHERELVARVKGVEAFAAHLRGETP